MHSCSVHICALPSTKYVSIRLTSTQSLRSSTIYVFIFSGFNSKMSDDTMFLDDVSPRSKWEYVRNCLFQFASAPHCLCIWGGENNASLARLWYNFYIHISRHGDIDILFTELSWCSLFMLNKDLLYQMEIVGKNTCSSLLVWLNRNHIEAVRCVNTPIKNLLLLDQLRVPERLLAIELGWRVPCGRHSMCWTPCELSVKIKYALTSFRCVIH